MQPFLEWLAANPYPLLFTIVLLAAVLARARIAGVGLDVAAAAILVGGAIAAAASAAGVKLGVDGTTKSIACWIFMYCLGLRIGPSLAGAFRRDGARFAVLAIVSSLLGLAGTVALVKLWSLPPGTAGGMLAGSMTSPAAIGPAEQALRQGVYQLPDSHLFEEATGMIALAFGLTYLWGVAGIFLACRVLPRALGIDLRAEARRHEEQEGARPVEDSGLAGLRPIAIRAYRVANEKLSGCTVREFLERNPALRIVNVLRTLPARREPAARSPGSAIAFAAAGVHGTARLRDPDTTLGNYGREAAAAETLYARLGAAGDVQLRQGDILTLGGAPGELADGAALVGPEVHDAAALNVPIDRAEIVVTNKALDGCRLGELRTADFAGEVALHHIERGGVSIPVGVNLRLQRMDVLFVAGVKGAVERFAAYAGRIARPSASAELLALSAGMIAGLLLGSVGIRIGERFVALGNAGGLLLSGIALSWIASRWGAGLGGAARGVLTDLALAAYVAILGLEAGAFLATGGLGGEAAARILVGGFFVSTLPAVAAWAIGYHLLRINPAVLVGCVAGARLQGGPVEDAAARTASSAPWIGYPVAYSVSALLLALSGWAAMALS